jgi:hypothetical protein
LPGHEEVFPKITGLDWHRSKGNSHFIAGTSGCDIWVVDEGGAQYAILDGHSAGVAMVAPHPQHSHLFVSADDSGNVLRYNSQTRMLECRTLLDFKCYALAVSSVQSLAFFLGEGACRASRQSSEIMCTCSKQFKLREWLGFGTVVNVRHAVCR